MYGLLGCDNQTDGYDEIIVIPSNYRTIKRKNSKDTVNWLKHVLKIRKMTCLSVRVNINLLNIL